jgi:RNA 3'-terminal phosphate cyclase (ATP)
VELIRIDGSVGGGQILRTSLALSALTGRAFAIDHIRKKRDKPGLMRQHLTAVRAAAQICDAEVVGGELGSTRVEFRPGKVRAGSYRFSIGSAGSAGLVLQTVLPPLMVADGPSDLAFEGGTHNPMSPPYPFLDRVFFPLLERMGVGVERSLLRAGFYPAGGGEFHVRLRPARVLSPLELLARGALRKLYAEAHVANIPHHVGLRELAVVKDKLGVSDDQLHLRTPESRGPGNALLLIAEHEHAVEQVSGFGEQGVRAERVAERACEEMEAYLQADVPVGEHLADQLLIPLAMAGAGRFRTLGLSDHSRTNLEVVQQFLPVRLGVSREADGSCLVFVEKQNEKTD